MPLAEHILLHLDGVGKTYQMGEVKIHALRGVDLDLFPGELVVLLWPVGKRQVHDAEHPRRTRCADERRVHFRDHDLTAYDDAALASTRASTSGSCSSFTT